MPNSLPNIICPNSVIHRAQMYRLTTTSKYRYIIPSCHRVGSGTRFLLPAPPCSPWPSKPTRPAPRLQEIEPLGPVQGSTISTRAAQMSTRAGRGNPQRSSENLDPPRPTSNSASCKGAEISLGIYCGRQRRKRSNIMLRRCPE